MRGLNGDAGKCRRAWILGGFLSATAVAARGLAAAGSVPASAGVEVFVVRPPEAAPTAAKIVAERVAGPELPQSPVQVAVDAPSGRATLQLGPGVWRLVATSQARRSWPSRLTVSTEGAAPSHLTLELWDVGRVSGRLRVPAGEAAPGNILLVPRRRFEPGPSRGGTEEAFPIPCPVEESRWVCELPAGQLDLELDLSPYMPRYLWSVAIPAQRVVDVGELVLVRGASVSGWALAADSRASDPPVTIELVTPGGERIPDGKGGALARFDARSNARGFFQSGPVPAATYELRARRGVLASHPTMVQLSADRELRLRSPIVLQPPATLSVTVDPPLDPEGKRWHTRLLSVAGQRGQVVVRGEPFSEEGEWFKAGLPSGSYRLAVTTSAGEVWHEGAAELEPGSGDVRLSFQTLHVTGTVSIGEEPLAARVRLGSRKGSARGSFQSGADGRFEGYMRRLDQGEWSARVDSSKPLVRRVVENVRMERVGDSEAHISIRLPDAAIEGVVLNEAGGHFADTAFVFAHPLDDESGLALVQVMLTKADEGRFRLIGLAPGAYRVQATVEDDELQSDEVRVEAKDEGTTEKVTLVLRRSASVAGRVVGVDGSPIPGAEVLAVAVNAPFALVSSIRSDVDGRFSLLLPAGTRDIVIRVSAFGFARRLLRRPTPTEGELVVALDPVGGTLVLEGLSEDHDHGPGAYVLHEGGFEKLASLARWSAAHGETPGEGSLRVPQMEAGAYRVCRSAPDEYAALISGTLPPSRCSDGFLARGGEVVLSVPPAPENRAAQKE